MSLRRVFRNLSIFFSLILVLIIGLVVYVLTLDPSQFRGQITDLAAQQGIDLRIEGDMAWRFYPELSLEIGDIYVAVERPEAGYAAEVDRIELLVQLWPLLKREFRLRGLNIDGADILLSQNEAEPELVAEDAAIPAPPETPAPLPILVAERMEISNSSLRIVDAAGVESLTLQGIDLLIENLNLTGDDTSLSGSLAQLRSGGEPLLAPLEFDLQLNILPDSLRAEIRELSASVQLDGVSLPLQLTGNLQLGLADQSFTLSSLRLRSGQNLTLDASLQGQLTELGYQGNLDLQVTNPRALLAQLGAELPEMSDAALQRFGLQTQFQGAANSISMNGLRWQLDQSSFQGDLQLGWGELSNLVLRGQLDQINLDNYLDQAETEEVAAAEPQEAVILVPVLPFNRSDIDIEISSLQVAEIPMRRVHLVLNSNTRQMRLQQLSGEVFGGDFNAQASLQLAGELPHQFDVRVNNVAIDQFLATRMEDVPFAGSVSLQLTGLASGVDPIALRQSLEADGRVQATNLIFRGQDVEQVMCDISDRIERRSLQSSYADWGEATRFSDVDATLRIEDGVARLLSLRSGVGNIGVTGQGNFNLEQKNYQLDLIARIQGEQTSIQGCAVHTALRNREIPLQCRGNASDPESLSCGIPQEFTRSLITGALTRGLSNLLGDEVTPEEQSNPRNLIEGLLRRSLGQ